MRDRFFKNIKSEKNSFYFFIMINKEQSKSLRLKKLIEGKKLTFLVGAGCSVDPPSNLPSAFKMMKAIIEHSCSKKYKSDIKKLIESGKFRFEMLAEIFQQQIDHDLKFIEFFTLSEKPNIIHFFLTEMMKQGHFVMTTNFDNLIEYGLLQSKIPESNIIPVITKDDFKEYADPSNLYKNGLFPIYKIHGCLKNILTGEDTKDSPITTIRTLGQNKQDLNLFQLDSGKLDACINLLNGRTLLVIGYSGSDDFDIVPSLIAIKNLNEIIWIEHVQDEEYETQIEKVDENFIQPTKVTSRVDEILIEFKKNKKNSTIFKVKGNTRKILENMVKLESRLDEIPFDIDLNDWFNNNIKKPSQFQHLQVPYKIYYSVGMNEKAFQITTEIQELAEQERNEYWKTVALNNRGVIYQHWNRYNEALECFDIVLKSNLLKPLDCVEVSHNKVIIFKKKGLFLQGIAEIRRILTIAINEQNCDIVGLLFSDLGHFYILIGDMKRAKIFLKRASAIFQISGNWLVLGITLLYFALIYERIGDYKSLYDYINKAFNIFKKLNYLNGLHLCHNSMGVMHSIKHESDLAFNHYQKALILANKTGDKAAKATIYDNIGNHYKKQGDYNRAVRYYSKALSIDNKIKDIAGMIKRFRNLGHIHELKTKFDIARKYYQNSLKKSKELGNPREIDLSLVAIGVLDLKEKNYDDAIKNLDKSKLNSEKRKDLVLLCTIYYNISLIFFEQQKLDDSCNELEKAFNLNKKLKFRENLMHNKYLYGRILQKRGSFQEALKKLEESYQIAQEFQDLRHQGKVLRKIGHVRKNKGEFELAIDTFMNALKIAENLDDSFGQVVLLRDIAISYAKNGDISSARLYLNRALDFFILKKVVHPNLESKIKNNLKYFS